MFRSNDHLQVEIYTMKINSTDSSSSYIAAIGLTKTLTEMTARNLTGD
jgi:hypothetical protein